METNDYCKEEDYEGAAYEYCRIKGVDPEEMVAETDPDVLAYSEIARWRNIARELEEHYIKHMALKKI